MSDTSVTESLNRAYKAQHPTVDMERETSRSATQHNPENMFGEGVPVVSGCLEHTTIEAEEARETKVVFTMVVGARV